jgi:fatty acid desaturase
VAVQPKSIRPPVPVQEHHRRAAAGDRPPAPRGRRSGPPDATEILFVFVTAILVMVAAVTVVAEVNRWWVLVPVMVVALVTVLGVLATITHLLADDG